MTTDFYIVSGETVPSDYFWDVGTPLTTAPTRTELKTVGSVVSGYAPAVRVTFQPDVRDIPFTTTRTTIISTEYIWNFGDYYNDVSNEISLQCPQSPIEHTFVMPGIYDISLTSLVARELIPDPIITPRCYGKHRQGWFWNATKCDVSTPTTWFDTECESITKPKWWDDEDSCFGEYCMFWSWWATDIEGSGSLNPMRWFQTRRGEELQKRWRIGVNSDPCETELKSTFDVLEQVTVKQVVVVIENSPTANILPIAQKLTGHSPLTIQLSPRKCKTGSFPIDKIVWDFGDETPLLTITRYNPPNLENIIHTNTFFDDPEDPRNYDIIHTFQRTKNNYSMFYPSLTCYSANTNTSDSCSITIGPVLFEIPDTDYELLAVSTTDKGVLYSMDFNNTIGFLTPTPILDLSQNFQIPKAPIRQIADYKVRFFGNPGDENYFLRYISNCEAPFAPRYIPDMIAFEEDVTTGLLLEDGITLLCT